MKTISVPFFSLQRHVGKLEKKAMSQLQAILESQQFVGGKAVALFEEKLKTFLNVDHAISCNSGTDGLWLALKALDLKHDSIVLTTSFSFIASSSEIVAHGAHPVFIDVETKTYNMDINLLQKWLEENAQLKDGKAVHKKTGQLIEGIVSVDLFGQCMDYTKLRALTDKWKLWVVEDACQAIGAHVDGKKAGKFGDIGVFSFYPTKNLGAFGDAGAVVTDNPKLAERILRLKNHGRSSHYNYEFLGINSRMDGFQGAILALKLDDLDAVNARRHAIAQQYNKAFAQIGFMQLPKEEIGSHVYHQYCITMKGQEAGKLRDALIEHLKKHTVGFNIFYPKTLPEIEFLSTSSDLATQCSVSDDLTKTILALPVWPDLTDEEVAYVCNVVQDFACQQDGPHKETMCSVSRFYGGNF